MGLVRALSNALLFSAVLASATFAEPAGQSYTSTNVDPSSVLSIGSTRESLGARIFAGDEGLTYVDARYARGIGRDSEVILRVTGADRKDMPLSGGQAIRHGGVDIEIGLRRQL